MAYKVISLFSGCGGLDLGFRGGFSFLDKSYPSNPFEFVFANDIDVKAVKTYKNNFHSENVVCADITEILNGERQQIPKGDIVIGGFPCQDFSLSGKRQGITVKRGKLYQSMVKVVSLVKPKIFIAENVKGLLSHNNGLTIKTITDDFSAAGYNVSYKLFNTADFGVPQMRERIIIVGIRQDIGEGFEWMSPTVNSAITIKQAISDLENEDFHKTLPNFGYSKAKLFEGKQGNITTKADKPSPTIRAEHHGNIEFHYSLPRRLSVRETARIQTFPDDFIFCDSLTDAYRQIGNAVPPVFGWYVAQMTLNILKRIE